MTQTFGIPIYARGIHPNAGTAAKLGRSAVTVQMGDVQVEHGDVVLGDDDGVVVASFAELEVVGRPLGIFTHHFTHQRQSAHHFLVFGWMQWLPEAEAIVEKESKMLARIRKGESLIGVQLRSCLFACACLPWVRPAVNVTDSGVSRHDELLRSRRGTKRWRREQAWFRVVRPGESTRRGQPLVALLLNQTNGVY
eukprot:SAG11_NODE_505_length_8888_cov_12.479235_5_plen_195_part_00